MRFRLGVMTGFATGYYLGAKAGRQRYEQINRTLQKVRRSDAFETASSKAKAAVDEGVDKARSLVEDKLGNGRGSDDTVTPAYGPGATPYRTTDLDT